MYFQCLIGAETLIDSNPESDEIETEKQAQTFNETVEDFNNSFPVASGLMTACSTPKYSIAPQSPSPALNYQMTSNTFNFTEPPSRYL